MRILFQQNAVFSAACLALCIAYSAPAHAQDGTALPLGTEETVQKITAKIAEKEGWCDPSESLGKHDDQQDDTTQMIIYWTRNKDGDCTIPHAQPVNPTR